MKKRIICALTAAVFIITATLPCVCAIRPDEKFIKAIDCTSADTIGVSGNTADMIAVELETQRIIVDSNIDKQFHMTGKLVMLLTALTAVRKITVTDITVEAQCITDPNNNVLSLKPGMSVNINDLLAAALIYNDVNAARALAIAASGSFEAFTSLMNDVAYAVGMRSTKVTGVTGRHDEAQVTTLRDLAAMIDNFGEYSSLVDITSSKVYYVKTASIYSSLPTLTNDFFMINESSDYYRKDAYGIGTETDSDGVTTGITLARKSNEKYIIITRTGNDSFRADMTKALDYISANFELLDISNVIYQLAEKMKIEIGGESVNFSVSKNSVRETKLIASSYYSKSVSTVSNAYKIVPPSDLPSAVNIGDRIDGFDIYYNNIYITTVTMVVASLGEQDSPDGEHSYTIYEANENSLDSGRSNSRKWMTITAVVVVLGVIIILLVSKIEKV